MKLSPFSNPLTGARLMAQKWADAAKYGFLQRCQSRCYPWLIILCAFRFFTNRAKGHQIQLRQLPTEKTSYWTRHGHIFIDAVVTAPSGWGDWYQYSLAVVVCVPQAPQVAYFIVLFWVPTADVKSSLKSPLLKVECKLKGRSLKSPKGRHP